MVQDILGEKLSLPIKISGKTLDPSDLRMRLDVSVRDNKTITRKIIENQNQATAGQRAVSIQFSGDYNLTKQLMLRIYFDRRVNTPHICFNIFSYCEYQCWFCSKIST